MSKNTKRRRAATSEVRILPATIVVGAILFALKAGGLAFGANAAESEPAQQAATASQTEAAPQAAPAPQTLAPPQTLNGLQPAAAPPARPSPPKAIPTTQVEAKPLDAPKAPEAAPPVTLPNAAADPLAAINEALPNRPDKPLIAQPETPATPPISGELPDGGVSAAEMDVLTSLSERRDALDQRQRELDLKSNVIAAAEKRVDDKIAQLKSIQATIEKLLGQRDTKETETLDGLVRIYAAMKPKDAARIFETLDNDVRLGVAGRMKPDTVAGIMSSLPAEVAQKITVELAGRYKMTPEIAATAAAATAQAASPAPPAPAPAAAAPPARPGG